MAKHHFKRLWLSAAIGQQPNLFWHQCIICGVHKNTAVIGKTFYMDKEKKTMSPVKPDCVPIDNWKDALEILNK